MPPVAESVLEAAGIGGWEMDVATGRLEWTPAMFGIHELDPPDAPSAADAMLFCPPEARPAVAAAVRAALDSGTPWDIETPLVTARGRRLWVRNWGLALREAGRTVRVVGALQDVTARRALDARTERLSIVAAQMTNIVITTDRDGRIDWVNGALTRLTGHTLAALKGRKPGDLLQGPASDPATVRTMARGIRDGAGFDVEIVNYTAAGLPYWVAITCSPLRDAAGTVNGFIAVQADITARRAAEDAARAAAAERERADLLLRDVLDALPNAITAYDSDDRLLMSNRRYAEMFPIAARFAIPGRAREEIVRLATEHGQYLDAPDEPAARAAWLAALRRRFHDGTTYELRLPDGRVAELRESRSRTGNRVTVRTDVTDLRRAEARAAAEAAERARADALLRDVLDTVPSAIVAYDRDERLILTNPAVGGRESMPPAFFTPGERLEDLMRLAVTQGYFVDAPSAPAEQEAWLAQHLAYLRDPAGVPRTMRLRDGHVVQFCARQSESGNLVIVRTDITEQVQAQTLLRDVVNTVPSAIVAYDRDERLVVTNPADAERASMPPAFSALGERLEDVMRLAVAHGYFLDAPAAPAEHEGWIARLLTYLRDPVAPPRPMRLNDGRTVLVSARRSESGHLVIVRTDITLQVQAQTLLRDVMEAMPSAVVAYDAEERVILANRALGEMAPMLTGVAEAATRLADVLRAGADGGYFADLPPAAAARDAWLGELLAYFRNAGDVPRTLRVSDGHSVQVRGRRSANGNLVVVSTDITQLMTAKALLRDVMEALPSAVIAYDADERVILSNRAHAEMAPIAARFTDMGSRLADVIRQSAENGYFADAPSPPAERAAWIAELLAFFRDSSGTPRTLRIDSGRFIQVRTRRSGTGNLVIVRTDITELLTAQALLRDVLDAIPDSVAAYDLDDRLILFNPAYGRMFPDAAAIAVAGRRYEEIVRYAVEQGSYPDAGEASEARDAWIAEQVAHHRLPGETRSLHLADGRVMMARECRSDSGTLVTVRTDITELTRTEALLRDILEALPSAVIAYDHDERLVLWNRAAADMLPLSAHFAAVGRTLEEMLRFSASSDEYLDAGATPEQRERLVAARLALYRTGVGARTLRMRDGRFLHALERRSASGNLVCVRTDVTDLTHAEEHLRWQAERDPLTRLHNRTFFLTALDRALAADTPGEAAGGVLLLLDIDYFKQINDALGHDMGDALLMEIAARLRLHLRGGGEGAARLGGDEFGVVIPGLADPEAAMARVGRLHAALSAPVDLGGRPTPIGLSMGVTVFPTDGTEAAKLLKNADLALYRAKRDGRGRWAAFQREQATALERHVHMADALRDALAKHQFTVALQPKRMLRDGAHAGFEALARWHDGAVWVSPGAFIPVAEETGLIRPLGHAIMAAALARVRDIRAQGVEPGRVAVNVTGQQLLDPTFEDETMAALRRCGLLPADLELELTGPALFGRASEQIDAVLRDLSDSGVTLTLDDFGTGYASLAHLSRLPIDWLKIDRLFVAGIGRAGPGGVIARSVIGLARGLGMRSIAKGVETETQMAFLHAAGCDAAQGYLYARPLLTTEDAVAYLRARTPPSDRPTQAVDRIAPI